MVEIFRFYWLCLKEAWRGLFDLANAWATVLGAIVIYVALWLLGYRLMIPETLEEAIGLAILSLVAAGVALFIVRFVAAPGWLYLRTKSEVDLLKGELHKRADDPAVEAQRQHTAAVIAHTEALKTKPQSVTPTAGGGAIVLAGIINTLMDRALQHGFKIAALRPSDPFTQLYEDVKNSIDPVWIDDEINQLRRDFLQYCAIVGFKERNDLKEMQSDRAELRGYGLKLIASLTGTATISPDIWKAAPDAVAAFADPDLIAERDKWKQTFEDAVLRGYEAQDKIAALQKQMGGIFGLDGTGELGTSQRKLEAAAMQSDMAKGELRRAWDALRADIHAKLLSGNLVARGFRCPHVVGSSEVVVPASEWRVLFLQNVTSEASSKTSSDALYEGVVIRKRLAV